jgi:hypothetical protein
MFYVKEKLSDTVEINAEIHDDNVFCTCPGCGSEVCVDLAELLNDGEGDLYSASVYCPACSMKRLEENR